MDIDVDVRGRVACVLFQSIGHTDKLVGGLTCVDEMLIGKALVDEIILCSCVEQSCGFDAVEGEGVDQRDLWHTDQE